jgi:hypothetical protein
MDMMSKHSSRRRSSSRNVCYMAAYTVYCSLLLLSAPDYLVCEPRVEGLALLGPHMWLCDEHALLADEGQQACAQPGSKWHMQALVRLEAP